LGFTLVELMVTVAVAAVLLVVAVPGMSELYRNARLSQSTDQLIASLNQARLEAIRQRTDVIICPASNPNTASACAPISSAAEIGLAKGYWSRGWVVVDSSNVLSRVTLPTGVVIDSTSAPSRVVFSGTLGSSSVSTQFKFCVSNVYEQIVDVGLSGALSKSISTSNRCS